ncbi:unnamed protein product [Zymoseptoria tritici ST99CH_1E4]|uniref:Uncharacterized protein n=1 Tax=Zymoseptoria tritici ST99CH_1E4 TaxID=1276532 RepID=A0A2H1G4J5_ZYMTR|nr:unnamed protein product [Zymoseptoria tritici ST99CH_1E4]
MDDDQRAQRKIQKAKARKEKRKDARKEKRDNKHAATRQHDNSASLPHPLTAPPAPHSTDPQPPQSRAGDQLDRQHTEQSQAAYQKTTSRQASNMPPPRSAAPGHRTPVQSAHQPQTHALEAVAGAFPSLLHNARSICFLPDGTTDITFFAAHKPRNASKHIHSLQQDAHPHTSKRRKVDHTHDGQTHHHSKPQTTLLKENIQQPGSQAHGETEMDVDAPPPTRSAAESSPSQTRHPHSNLEESKKANTHKSQIVLDVSSNPKEHNEPGLGEVDGVRSHLKTQTPTRSHTSQFEKENLYSASPKKIHQHAAPQLQPTGRRALDRISRSVFVSSTASGKPSSNTAQTSFTAQPSTANTSPSLGKFSSRSAAAGPLSPLDTRQALKALSCNTGTPSLAQLSSASRLAAHSTRKQDLSQPAGGVPPVEPENLTADPSQKKPSLAIVDGRPILQLGGRPETVMHLLYQDAVTHAVTERHYYRRQNIPPPPIPRYSADHSFDDLFRRLVNMPPGAPAKFLADWDARQATQTHYLALTPSFLFAVITFTSTLSPFIPQTPSHLDCVCVCGVPFILSAAVAMDRPSRDLLHAEMRSAMDSLRPARDQHDFLEQLPVAIEAAIAKATQRSHAAPAEDAASASRPQATHLLNPSNRSEPRLESLSFNGLQTRHLPTNLPQPSLAPGGTHARPIHVLDSGSPSTISDVQHGVA